MSIQSSHAMNSTSGAGECDLYPPSCGGAMLNAIVGCASHPPSQCYGVTSSEAATGTLVSTDRIFANRKSND
jgi:hypothetical protein